jgi:hypothetical protein
MDGAVQNVTPEYPPMKPQWVPQWRAAAFLGCSPANLFLLRKSGRVKSRTGRNGGIEVAIDDLLNLDKKAKVTADDLDVLRHALQREVGH